jgi:DNA-directed RNA polymerase specialized sigma24 family protein
MHFTRENHAAEDLAQDVFVKLVSLLRGNGYDPDRGRFAPFFTA